MWLLAWDPGVCCLCKFTELQMSDMRLAYGEFYLDKTLQQIMRQISEEGWIC